MSGLCPQCAKRQGAHSHAGKVQNWTKPVCCLKTIPADLDPTLVPHITIGECGHTVSLREWKQANSAN